jgi:hypothetical protein
MLLNRHKMWASLESGRGLQNLVKILSCSKTIDCADP